MPSLLKEHLVPVCSLVLSIVTTAGGCIWSASSAKSDIEQMKQKVELLYKTDALNQQTRWAVEALQKDQMKADARLETTVATLNDMKSDLRVVKEWVDEQKRKDRKAP